MDSFLTLLYQVVEHCNYRDLRNERIRYRIIVGLHVSERLQTDPELTVDEPITMA